MCVHSSKLKAQKNEYSVEEQLLGTALLSCENRGINLATLSVYLCSRQGVTVSEKAACEHRSHDYLKR